MDGHLLTAKVSFVNIDPTDHLETTNAYLCFYGCCQFFYFQVLRFVISIFQCHIPGGNDAGYLNNLNTEFESNPDFAKGDGKNWDKQFGIRHYAGKVMYTVKVSSIQSSCFSKKSVKMAVVPLYYEQG